jgi:hypothetical protein
MLKRAVHALLAASLVVSARCAEVTQLDLPLMPPLSPHLSFSNPFRQYQDGLIPLWEYGGATMLSNDYLSLTSASTNQLGWIWSSEPVSTASDCPRLQE